MMCCAGVVGSDERRPLPSVLRLDEPVHVHHRGQRADCHVPGGVAVRRGHHPSGYTEPVVPGEFVLHLCFDLRCVV
jgi:hypothetical protein